MQDASLLRLGLGGRLLEATVPEAEAVGAQLLLDWVENAPAEDTSKIALGYPVPIRVNTPLPFDGFRTYEGLLMRHQDLAATTFRHLGIDLDSHWTNHRGRPIAIVQEGGRPIPELG